MDDSARLTPDGLLHSGEQAAAQLGTDAARVAGARRLVPRDGTAAALDRLVRLAARLLGTPAGQVSLLTDVQRVAAGMGLALGTVGSDGPLAESLCTVTAASGAPLVVPDAWNDERVHDLPPVSSGAVGAYLGIPLVAHGGGVIGALCARQVRSRRTVALRPLIIVARSAWTTSSAADSGTSTSANRWWISI